MNSIQRALDHVAQHCSGMSSNKGSALTES
jgi:hypothetical protein